MAVDSSLPLEQTKASQVLRDEQGLLTFEEVRQSNSWKDVTKDKDTYPGFDHTAFWLKTTLTSFSSRNGQWLLSLNSTRWEEIDWYLLRSNGEIEHVMAGNAREGRAGHARGFT